MLTPAFEIRQDDQYIFIKIKAPFTNIKNCDIYVHEDEFKFFSEPYFLRLNLPGKVTESDKSSAKYDADSGTFHVSLEKTTVGEHFEDLELLTKLLAPKLKPGQSIVEEIGDVNEEDLDDEDGDIWQVNQEIYEERLSGCPGRRYGFNRSKSGVVQRMQDFLPKVCDITDPDSKDIMEARMERLANEKQKFSDIHYLDDYFDEEGIIRSIVETTLNYSKDSVELTENEREYLSKLPAKSYLMDKYEKLNCLLSLVEIIYAFAYTNRVNAGDWNSESGWTVAKVSATLSHFEEFLSLKAVKQCCLRRSLIFPFYRNFELSEECWRDAIEIFEGGTLRVLKCLLIVHGAFSDDNDGRHLLNELYINDYVIWIQRYCKESRLRDVAEKMKLTTVSKDDLALGIEALETAANAVANTDAVDSDDTDCDSDSSTSAHDSDDYHSDDAPDSSDTADTRSSSSETSNKSASSVVRTL